MVCLPTTVAVMKALKNPLNASQLLHQSANKMTNPDSGRPANMLGAPHVLLILVSRDQNAVRHLHKLSLAKVLPRCNTWVCTVFLNLLKFTGV